MPNDEFQEWVKKYEEKTNQKVEFGDGFRLLFLVDKGFARFKFDEALDILMVKEVCGDGKFWYKFLYDFAKELGVSKMATFLCRDLKVMARIFKAKLIEKTDECHKFKCFDGNTVEVYPYNSNVYFAIQYLQPKE